MRSPERREALFLQRTAAVRVNSVTEMAGERDRLCYVLLPTPSPAEHCMAMPAIQRRWTADAVRELIREDQPWPRYELIDGELLVTPAPRDAHQFACFELCRLLNAFLEGEPIGVVTMSPSDVPIPPDNVVQPDVYVVPTYETEDERAIDWPTRTYLLLAAEVLSPSSLRTDRITKRELYLDNGVAEYWIVDLDARVVERWRPTQLTPALFRETLTWTPREGSSLTIDLPTYFDRVAAKDRAHERWRKRT